MSEKRKYFWEKNRDGESFSSYEVEVFPGEMQRMSDPKLNLSTWSFVHPKNKEVTCLVDWALFETVELCLLDWIRSVRKTANWSDQQRIEIIERNIKNVLTPIKGEMK